MSDFIGISEDRLHHILSVARECYQIAKRRGYDEIFCRRMFMIGWNHDVGYEFSKKQSDHPIISKNLLELVGVTDNNEDSSRVLDSIREHGLYVNEETAEWTILNIADMTIDSKGNKVDVMQRLNDIKNRYGEYSNQYLTACDLAYSLKLTSENIASEK